MNGLKTAVLLAVLTALVLFIGGAIGGRTGMLIALVIAAAMNLGAYWYSDKMVLRMYRAEPVGPGHPSGLYEIVQHLAKKGQLPMPKVYIINTDAPNAFATGRNPENASVAATTGILRLLTPAELTGVMAHELSHVQHHDTLISAVSATLAGAISMIANLFMWTSIFGGSDRNDSGIGALGGIVMLILAPLAAGLIQMAISRSREFAADEAGAKLCKQPRSLASALEKIEQFARTQVFNTAEKHPATAHLFIINPLNGKQLKSLFSTHPPTEERVKRLREMVI